MPYFPKNRIVSNLFTQGKELVIQSTGQEYKGFYYKTYTGQFFSGKTPQDKPNRKLVPIEDGGVGISTIDQQINFLNKDSDSYNKTQKNLGKNLDISNQIPLPITITPSKDFYNIGEFVRYFYKKRNEILYIETTKDHYTNTLSNKSQGTYILYKPFKLTWKLTGETEEVAQTNRNIVALTEKNQNLPGLSKYLDNPLQFYSLDS